MLVRFKKIAGVVISTMMLALLLAGCGSQVSGDKSGGNKIKVVATIYPVYEFAKQVGGDRVEVSMLLAPGAEPHDWEPTPKELMQIKKAKLFLYHGAGLEPTEKLIKKEVLGETQAVEVSKGVPLLKEEGKQEDADEDHAGHDHGHGPDAHTWLDPVYAQQEVNHIAEALAGVDPSNADYYRASAVRYNKELALLDQEYRTALANVSSREVVTSHTAFGYMAKRYQLQQVGIMGLSPDAEPTPDKMAKVISFCREHNVKYIFYETLVNPKLANTIAKETGAGLLVLNPLESLSEAEMKEGKNYLSVMRENLANLQKALH